MRYASAIMLFIGICCTCSGAAGAGDKKTYVGSEACKTCHAQEYERFMKYSKQAKSYESVALMKKGLTESELQGCYKCHTTGYGQPGGFRSLRQTPRLKEAGCETCHGPGSLHYQTGDKKDIKGKLTAADCKQCHSDRTIQSFGVKPLVYGGVH